MSANDTTVGSLEDTLTFPFREEGWQSKLLVGLLVQLSVYAIPILPGIPLAGYSARIMRRIIVEDGKPHLPAWDDWNTLLRDGLRLFGITVVSVAPAALLAIAAYSLFMLGVLSGPILAESGAGAESPLAILTALLTTFGGVVAFALTWVLSLATALFLPPAQGHVIATGKFGAAFRICEWWPIFRANLGGYILCYLLLLGLWTATTLIFQILYMTVCLCCRMPVLMVPALFYTSVLAHTLFARAYRIGADKLAAEQG